MSMEPCCALKYFPELDVCQSEKDGDMDAKKKAMEQAEEEDFGSTKFGKWRSWMWNTIEYPWTSKLAQVGKNVLCIFRCDYICNRISTGMGYRSHVTQVLTIQSESSILNSQ